MHNGGKKDLAAVVDFYSRGGDFPNPSKRMKELNLKADDQAALVDFLQNALTDCRVAREEAPFDHPSLVKVYRFWEDNQTAYMVMPYLQGVTLRPPHHSC